MRGAQPGTGSSATPVYGTWVAPAAGSILPPARCDHVLKSVDYARYSQLFLFGGMSSSGPVNDVWTAGFSGNQVAWTAVVDGAAPSQRYGHTASVTQAPVAQVATKPGPPTMEVEPAVYVYGGLDSFDRYLDDIYQYAPSTGAWTQVREASFAQPVTSAAPAFTLQSTQPSARMYTHWRTINVTFAALRALTGELVTANLAWYLNSTASLPATNITTAFLTFGGRSDPANIFSTALTSGYQSPGTVGHGSPFNVDYADLWMYVAAADVWFRVGNATCTDPSQLCSDFTNVSNLSSNAVPTILASLTALTNAPVRPAGLINRTEALLTEAGGLMNSLDAVLSYLMSAGSGFLNDDGASCYDTCDDPQEVPDPTVPPLPPQVCSVGGLLTPNGATFCNVTASGIVITQTRPNTSEGHAAATLMVTALQGGQSTVYYWQFGGFACFGEGVDVLSTATWDPSCLTQSLSMLDPTTMVWYTFSLPVVATTQVLWWPAPRVYASMAIDANLEQIWVYGGAAIVGGQWTYLNDLRLFDIASLSWLETSISGVAPFAGRGASLVWVPPLPLNSATGLFLFGGCAASGQLSNQFLQLYTSASLSAGNWLASGAALSSATAGVSEVFFLTAESLSVNNTFTGRLSYGVGLASLFSVTLSEINDEGTLVPLLSPTVTEVGDGGYTVNYTLDYGQYYQIDVRFLQSGIAQPIPGSPFPLTLLPAPYDPSHTSVVGTNYSQVEKSAVASVTMQLVDSYGNTEIAGAAPSNQPTFSLFYLDASAAAPVANVTGNSTGLLTPLGVFSTDNGDGSYTLSYTAPELSTFYLYVLVDGVNAYGSPYYVVGLDALQLPSSIQVAFLVLSLVLGMLVVVVMVGVVWTRDNRVVRAGSPLFLVLICVGVLLSIASVPVYAYPSDITCRLFPFLLTTGYILALSALFTKSYRVLLLFVSAKLTTVTLTDGTMLFPVFVLLLMETVLNLCWLIADPLVLVTYDASSVLPYHACGGPHAVAFVSASVAFNGAIALWGVYLAVRIRAVPEAFNESKLMGAALYNLALMLLIAIPLTWTASSTQTNHEDFLIPAAAILWCCAVTVATTVAPKLYYVINPPPPSFFEAYAQQNGVMIKGVKGRQASPEEGAATAGKHHSWDGATGTGAARTAVKAGPTMNAKRWGRTCPPQSDGAKEQVEIKIGSTPPSAGGKAEDDECPVPVLVAATTGHMMEEEERVLGVQDDETKEGGAAQQDSPSSGRKARPAPITVSPTGSAGEPPSSRSISSAHRLAPPPEPSSERSRHRRIDHEGAGAASPPSQQHSAGPANTPLSRPSQHALTASSSLDDLAYTPRLVPLLPSGPPLTVSRTGSPVHRAYPTRGASATISHSPYRLPTVGPTFPAPLSLGPSQDGIERV